MTNSSERPNYERPNIRAMQGYTWGEQPDDGKTIKLNTNENPFPPSPTVAQALAAFDPAGLRVYPQPTADSLRDLIADLHGLQRHNIIVTNGGDESLRLALTTFVEPGHGFGMATPSYSLYAVLAAIQDATLVEVPLQADWQMPADFAQQMNAQGVQLCCLVNPHAPSGTLYPREQLAEIAQALNGVLLIDEAYADFIDPDAGYHSADLVEELDNVLILRTFSKGYGLAGMRLGYLLGSTNLIDPLLNKTRDSYNMDQISQLVGEAAIKDQAYAQNTWAQVRKQRTQTQANLSQLGLHSPTSHSNFLLVTVGDTAKLPAAEIYARLKADGVLVRYFDTPALADKLRITIGTEEQNQRLLHLLTSYLSP